MQCPHGLVRYMLAGRDSSLKRNCLHLHGPLCWQDALEFGQGQVKLGSLTRGLACFVRQCFGDPSHSRPPLGCKASRHHAKRHILGSWLLLPMAPSGRQLSQDVAVQICGMASMVRGDGRVVFSDQTLRGADSLDLCRDVIESDGVSLYRPSQLVRQSFVP